MQTTDFHLAIDFLARLTHPIAATETSSLAFSEEYKDQEPITTALKILHQAVLFGSAEQKRCCLEKRKEIIALNELLAKGDLPSLAEKRLNIQTNKSLQDVQIAVPKTPFEQMIQTAFAVPQAAVSFLTDLSLLPIGGALTLHMLFQPTFDPKEPCRDKTPILLLHGSGYNESEWILGRQFLKKDTYGSVFSLNYDGLISNDPKKGIDDYAKDKVRRKILEIREKTGQDRIILIGHSMGGLIAGYYAENLSEQDSIQIDHIISIGSPWKGSPIVDRYMTSEETPKRYQQMSTDSAFRENLLQSVHQAERSGKRQYYSIGSYTDFLVPGCRGVASEDPRRQSLFKSLGHYGVIASPFVWRQISSWLDHIYEKV